MSRRAIVLVISILTALGFAAAAFFYDRYSASEETSPVTPTAFMLNDSRGSGFSIGMSIRSDTGNLRAHFMAANHSACPNGGSGDKGPVGPFAVNGQLVNFQGICLKGVLWLVPSSLAGEKWVLGSVTQGGRVALEIVPGEPVTFDTTGVEAALVVLERAQKAL